MAKIYYDLLLKESKLVSKKVIHSISDSGITSSHRRSSCKNLEATQLFVDFNKAFDSIHRGKMEQILQTQDLPKKLSQP